MLSLVSLYFASNEIDLHYYRNKKPLKETYNELMHAICKTNE
jgi:hypothetical protein